MLIECKECSTEISNEALICPHCGYSNTTNTSDSKSIGWLLGMAIFSMPFLFSWLTLRKGYSNLAKITSFCWLGFFVFAILSQDNSSPSSNYSSILRSSIESYSDSGNNNVADENLSASQIAAAMEATKRARDAENLENNPVYSLSRNLCPLRNGREYAGNPGYAAGEIFRIASGQNTQLGQAFGACNQCASYSQSVAIQAGVRITGTPMFDACRTLVENYSRSPSVYNALAN